MAIIKKAIPGLKPGSDYLFTLKPKNVEISAVDAEQDTIRVSIPAFDGVPSVITGLELASSFQTVIFKFDPVNDIDLAYFEYQLYDNEFGTGDPINAVNSTSKDSSTLISGTNTANVFLVDVENSTDGENKQYWGRVRSVNTSGNPGTDWTELIGSGDLDLIDDQFIGSLTAAKITAGTIGAAEITLAGATSIIKSSNYSTGVSGWKITGFGDAEFNDLTVRTSLDIGGNDTTSFHVDINGNMWSGAGVLNYSTAPFRVSNAGALVATNANITGAINATSGSFTGTVNASGGTFSSYITAGVTQIGKNVRDAADHNGIALDSGSWNNAWVRRSDGSVYFRAGTSTKYIQMDTQTGATSAIAFPNFSVDNNGSITATSANISGTVNSGNLTATGGSIAGWSITSNLLEGASSSRRIQLIKSVPQNATFYNNVSYWDMPAIAIFDSINAQAVGYLGTYSDNLVSFEGRTGDTWIEIDNDGLDSIILTILNSSTSINTGIHLDTQTSTGIVQAVWMEGYAGSGTRSLYVTSEGRITTSSSDISLKENISPIESVIEKVCSLNPVTFYWKDKLERGREKQIGLIAQEVEEIFPDLVCTNFSDDKKAIISEGLIFILIKAVQELNERLNNISGL